MTLPAARPSFVVSLFLAFLLCTLSGQRPIAQQQPLEVLFDFPQLPSGPAGALVRGPDGSLYGTVTTDDPYPFHGPTAAGGVFVLRPDGAGSYTYRLLHQFQRTDGATPFGLTLGPDGHLYGITAFGGRYEGGTIFRITMDGQFTSLYSFSGLDGREPWGRLLVANDEYLYGTTMRGGLFGLGTAFRVSTSGVVKPLHWFIGTDGAFPGSGLVQARDSHFYGTTVRGGSTPSGTGTVFRMTASGVVTRLHSFESVNESLGSWPAATLVLGSDGDLYGSTYRGGGTDASGTIFRITTSGAFTQLHRFPQTGPVHPIVSLTEAQDGLFYGVATGGLNIDQFRPSGLFRMTRDGKVEILAGFSFPIGEVPASELLQSPDGAFYGTTDVGGRGGCGTAFRFTPQLGVQTLYHFPCVIRDPYALTLGRDGQFYGVTRNAGSASYRVGSIFRLSTDGTYTPLAVVGSSLTDMSALTYGADGNLYGVARTGGGTGSGAVFRIGADGSDLTHLHSFGLYDGISEAPLCQADDGNLYGTAPFGGLSGSTTLPGMVYRVTPSGVFTKLHAFSGGADGAGPMAGLIQGRDGFLYGSTAGGGEFGRGTIFRITKKGVLTTIHSFTTAEGVAPSTALLEARDGDFYGMTAEGGANNRGTIFRMTASGAVTTLYSFTGLDDGGTPRTPLVEAPDGQLYGTSVGGHFFEAAWGAVFRLDANRAFSIVHTFPADASEGTFASSGVLLGPDGALYGTTSGGQGRAGRGLVYRIAIATTSNQNSQLTR